MCVLFYANTFLNWSFIPNSLQLKNGQKDNFTATMITQMLILIIETALLMLIMYFINKWYLSIIAKVDNPKNIAMWTAGIYAILNVSIIIIAIVSFYR